jgi:hypothetical protein
LNKSPSPVGPIITGIVGLALIVLLLIGGAFGCQGYNQVKVTAIQIQNQQQRVKIAKQQAQIRYQNAIGIKRAQDEIQKTLTPLYVQFEMVDALKEIAQSGKNNSLVYIPVGANGIPLISDAKSGAVGLPSK